MIQSNERQKVKMEEQLKVQLQEWDNRIQELESHSAGDVSGTVSEIKNKKSSAQQKLKDLKVTSYGNQWNSIKDSIDTLMADMNDSYRHALSQFK